MTNKCLTCQFLQSCGTHKNLRKSERVHSCKQYRKKRREFFDTKKSPSGKELDAMLDKKLGLQGLR